MSIINKQIEDHSDNILQHAYDGVNSILMEYMDKCEVIRRNSEKLTDIADTLIALMQIGFNINDIILEEIKKYGIDFIEEPALRSHPHSDIHKYMFITMNDNKYACLVHHCNYLDIGHYYWDTIYGKRLRSIFRKLPLEKHDIAEYKADFLEDAQGLGYMVAANKLLNNLDNYVNDMYKFLSNLSIRKIDGNVYKYRYQCVYDNTVMGDAYKNI